MRWKNSLLGVVVAVLCSGVASGQVRTKAPIPLDDRLAAIEDRLTALEDRVARVEEDRQDPRAPDRLTLESEAKLDRLEVRVIQLENAPRNCDCNTAGQRDMLARLRSVERQVARLRSAAIR